MSKVLNDVFGTETSVGVSKVKCRELFDSVNSKGYTPELDSQMYHIKNKILLRSASADVVENTQEAELYGKYCGLYVNKRIDVIIACNKLLSDTIPAADKLVLNHFTEYEKLAFWKGFNSVLPSVYKEVFDIMTVENDCAVGLNDLTVNEEISVASFNLENYEKLLVNWIVECPMLEEYIEEYSCDSIEEYCWYYNFQRELKFLSILKQDKLGKELLLYYSRETRLYEEKFYGMKHKLYWCNGMTKQIFELEFWKNDSGEVELGCEHATEGAVYYISTIDGSDHGFATEAWLLENVDLVCNAQIKEGKLCPKTPTIDVCEDAKEIKFLLWKQRKYYDVIVHPNKEFNDINHPRLIPELLKHAISESTH